MVSGSKIAQPDGLGLAGVRVYMAECEACGLGTALEGNLA
jgi:hypothetical protein